MEYTLEVKRKNIVIINGSATFGKNTFVKQMSEMVAVDYISSIDKYKEIATKYFTYNEYDKNDNVRSFLSELKALAIKYFNQPYKDTVTAINDFLESDSPSEILFIDIREPDEIEKIVNVFKSQDIVTLLINNPNKECNTSNTSDENVFDYPYDWIIENDGTIEDLKFKAIKFYNEILPHFVGHVKLDAEKNENNGKE